MQAQCESVCLFCFVFFVLEGKQKAFVMAIVMWERHLSAGTLLRRKRLKNLRVCLDNLRRANLESVTSC